MQRDRNKSYRVVETKQFKRDRKHVRNMGRYDMEKLKEVVRLLASNTKLPEHYRNHKLHGIFEGCEECHIQSNWLLIYRKFEDKLILQLTRTGRHADLFEE